MVSLEMNKHPLIKRMLWSCWILLIYIFGQEIPLPLVKYQSHIRSVVSEPIRAVISGSGMSNYSIFALGIGPMMIGLIVAAFAMQSKVLGLNRLPSKYNDRIQMIITILIALAQAYVSVRNFKLTRPGWETEWQVILVMVAGAMMIMWLCNMNAKLGLGGPMMIIMANVMVSLLRTVYNSRRLITGGLETWIIVIIGLVILVVVIISITLLMDRAEYRIPVIRLGINNQFVDKSYLPVKLSPAGGMPVMFAMAILSLPQYLFRYLAQAYPHNATFAWWNDNLVLSKTAGVITYIIILFLFSIAFALMNMDPEQLAEDYQKSGDYIPGFRPGRATAHYLRGVIVRFSIIGGIFITLIAGLPLIFAIDRPQYETLMMFPGNVMMAASFAILMLDQIDVILVHGKYDSIL
ncbi:accessory Sec system protein translocase subunit SecY2 [Limosilactobacillus gastricus]|nr:accessory Sec system protein translocase subunit SecY2 [Limosilactobacillus gastricus]QGF39761.1 accessory Sec system protein translocase subunit SecY2 [Limosilactobacillus gastricus]